MKRILDGKFRYEEMPEVGPALKDVEAVYVERPELHRGEDTGPIARGPACKANAFGRFKGTEVEEAIKAMRVDSAPGVDNILVSSLQLVPVNVYATIFDAWFGFGVPMSERANRTVLIPKEGDLSKVGNGRPLTIGNVVIRLYAKLWDMRLRKIVTLSERR